MEPISTQEFVKKYRHVNFLSMAQKEHNARVCERLLSLHHLVSGENRKNSAKMVGRNPEWIRYWILRYNEGGYQKLFDDPRTGQPKYLTTEQEQELVCDILKIQDKKNGGRITGADLTKHIEKKYAVIYKGTSIYDLLERLGLSWVSSRSKHPNSDEKKQEEFKKNFKKEVKKISKKKKNL